jgi:hypothetical protein
VRKYLDMAEKEIDCKFGKANMEMESIGCFVMAKVEVLITRN